jgi:hypothetical protein
VKRPHVISMRLDSEELAAIGTAAELAGVTVSEYIRNAGLRAGLLSRPGARIVHAQSGAEIAFWTNRPDLVAVS